MGDGSVRLPAIILAGGQARRMGGGDKGLLELGGETLLSRVLARLEPQVGPIALNANGDPARFESYGLPVIADSLPGFVGPLAGVLAGMDWAAELGAGQVVSVAADTPFFPRDFVSRLQAGAGDAPVTLAATPHPEKGSIRQPTFGLWSVDLRDDLRAALEQGLRKVVLWTDRHGASEVVFESEAGDPFFNINRPEDLVEALERGAWT
ncbi:molybdenum cofactor guanylyltransferase MobA [Tropicimonas sp. TH_r6]|uniref:molybdenum cofactor guanylyltransferase MobA n=1 Tax=Tropicimonas sp. TH_r6 TaxID=3082085 RepID=UPI00295312CB|nr:molybdenum cofactor guanylyltransferase MobA [Tropicimonas sp. TH_r6]MDV7141235.1 molybdenum cofactor guanylyltransferase MobA [Tropicimonas sp. TH_r6]